MYFRYMDSISHGPALLSPTLLHVTAHKKLHEPHGSQVVEVTIHKAIFFD